MLESAIGMQDSKLFSYLDFPVCFACYPPKSFKIICLTCIWFKFVDTTFHSSQKKPQKHTTANGHFTTIVKNHSLQASSPIWVSEVSLARTRERGGRPSRLRRSLTRSRETRFTRPNRRACSQARKIIA